MLEEKKFDVAEASEILWKEDVKPKLFGQFNKAVVTLEIIRCFIARRLDQGE